MGESYCGGVDISRAAAYLYTTQARDPCIFRIALAPLVLPLTAPLLPPLAPLLLPLAARMWTRGFRPANPLYFAVGPPGSEPFRRGTEHG